MNIGVAKVFQTGIKQKTEWLIRWFCTAKAQLYFHKLKGKLENKVGVVRATLCHTLATPLCICDDMDS